MTINETYFFRDKLPFDNFRDSMLPDAIKAPRSSSARSASGARRRRPDRKPIRSR